MSRQRYYTNFPLIDPDALPLPSLPPRRTSVTGTPAEIEELRHRKSRLTAKGSYHKRIDELARDHMIEYFDKAERAFKAGRFEFCRDQCFLIRASKPLSDTIKAKTYMLLAHREVLGDSAEERESFAKDAMKCWDIVIERKGYCHTRYPVEVAREQKKAAKQLLDQAHSDLEHRKRHAVSPLRQDDEENMDPALMYSSARSESQESEEL